LLALVEAQARQIELLTAQVAELERRLGRNSRNSSQPPSADGPAASSRRSTRQRSGRKPGKQPGTGGTTLGLLADPDEIIDHLPVACGGCGAELGGAAEAGVVRRQVHDIPTIRPSRSGAFGVFLGHAGKVVQQARGLGHAITSRRATTWFGRHRGG
jgi:transposase